MNTSFTFNKSVILLLTMIHIQTWAQTLSASFTTDKINIDGFLDEEIWQKTECIDEFYQFEPDYNAPASYQTILKVIYNSEMIVFAFDCKDPQPDRITARETKRDGDITGDDAVGLALDTFNDKNNAYVFLINPLSTQQDGRFADNGKTSDYNWDETWYAATRVYEGGWRCEIGIPFRSLKYNPNISSWGFNAGRWIARHKELHFFIKNLTYIERISQYGLVTGLNLKNLAVKKYSIIPYIQGEFEDGSTPVRNMGMDIRFNPVSHIGLSGTVNPDFATVEGDVEQVNLSRFEISYPEKRPFFLEGAENYSTRITQFYSRRIGEIPWGMKVNGKMGRWKLNGLITASDPSTAGADEEPGKKALYSVFRINSEFANGSNIGLIGANRTCRDKNSGSMGLTTTLFFNDVLGMTSQLIKSHGPANKGTWTYFVRPAYDTQISHFHIRYSHYGTGVRENMNTIGFISHDDRKEFDTNIQHIFWINKYGFDFIRPMVNYNQYWSQSGYLRSRAVEAELEVDFLKMFSLELGYNSDFKAEYDPYFEKDFHNHEWGLDAGFDNNSGFSANLEYKRGRNFDSDMEVIEGGLELKIIEPWDINYQFEKTWLQHGEPDDNSWIHYIRSSYYINTDLYIKLFYQTKYEVRRFWREPDFDMLRKTLQISLIWRFLPPFGSLQLACQEGTTRYTEEEGRGRTFFTKLSWIF